jgi:hypothetical protein
MPMCGVSSRNPLLVDSNLGPAVPLRNSSSVRSRLPSTSSAGVACRRSSRCQKPDAAGPGR